MSIGHASLYYSWLFTVRYCRTALLLVLLIIRASRSITSPWVTKPKWSKKVGAVTFSAEVSIAKEFQTQWINWVSRATSTKSKTLYLHKGVYLTLQSTRIQSNYSSTMSNNNTIQVSTPREKLRIWHFQPNLQITTINKTLSF